MSLRPSLFQLLQLLEAQESTLIAGRWDGSWMKTGPFLACGFYKDSKCSDDDTEQFLVGPYLTLYLGYLGLAWLNGGGGAFALDMYQRGVLL